MHTPRILIVDDDTHLLTALERILRRSQYQVTTAHNGRIGLRLAADHPPDLVLLDIEMPTMSGHDFLRRFRRWQDEELRTKPSITPDIPVIFLTGLAKTDQRIDGLDAGAVDYLTKPVDPDELRARIRSQLRIVQRQSKILSAAREEMLNLEATIGQIRDLARDCHRLVADTLGVLPPDTNHLANDNLKKIDASLTQIAQWPCGTDFWKET